MEDQKERDAQLRLSMREQLEMGIYGDKRNDWNGIYGDKRNDWHPEYVRLDHPPRKSGIGWPLAVVMFAIGLGAAAIWAHGG